MSDQRIDSNSSAHEHELFTVGALAVGTVAGIWGGKKAWRGTKNLSKKAYNGARNIGGKAWTGTKTVMSDVKGAWNGGSTTAKAARTASRTPSNSSINGKIMPDL